MRSEAEYKLLPSGPGADVDEVPEEGRSATFAAARRRQRTFRASLAIESILIVVLVAALFMARSRIADLEAQSSHLHYSPVDGAARYVETVFTSNLRESNIYVHYPNEDVDKAWIDLYSEYGLSKIPKAEAMKMANKTLPIPGDPEHYIIALSVFHQLHCLDVLRKAAYADYYTDPETGALGDIPKNDIKIHVTHCLDMIRQGIMCAGDITYAPPNSITPHRKPDVRVHARPLVFQWHADKQKAMGHMNVPHVCRDFESLKDWAREHKKAHDLDKLDFAMVA
ncbi:hypothetical protein EIP86_006445 [Pleurotus ostreatoroseus]|nr:hypothetical protein EIP86_006445 [Pleurotus ostreatoroseus]